MDTALAAPRRPTPKKPVAPLKRAAPKIILVKTSPGDTIRDEYRDARAKVERMVHEAMLTLLFMPKDRDRPDYIGNAWPAFPAEFEDLVARADMDREVKNLVPPWKITPRHVDAMFKVLSWFDSYKNREIGKNGILKYEWKLLEVRGWQAVYDRKSWRLVAEIMDDRMQFNRSHTWWKQQHDKLIEIAYAQACKAGDA